MKNLKKNLVEIGRGLFGVLMIFTGTGILTYILLLILGLSTFPESSIPTANFFYSIPAFILMVMIELSNPIILRPSKT